MSTFDIQDQKFNDSITAVEPNLMIHGEITEQQMSNLCGDCPADAIDEMERLERREYEVVELYYNDKDCITIKKHEALWLAKHFGLID